MKRSRIKSRPSKRTRPDIELADWCEARCRVECMGRAHHRHHLRRRSQGGTEGPTLDVCTFCHTYIHDHPAESYEKGWLIRGGST